MSHHNGQRARGLKDQRPPLSQNQKVQRFSQELAETESTNKAMTCVDILRTAHHAQLRAV